MKDFFILRIAIDFFLSLSFSLVEIDSLKRQLNTQTEKFKSTTANLDHSQFSLPSFSFSFKKEREEEAID